MSIKKIALAAGITAMMTSSMAYASVIDRPFFKVLGVVVVWGADGFADDTTAGTAPIASDFVLLTNASGTAGADLIADDVYSVVTGSLDPINGAAQSIDATATIDPITGQPTGGVFSDANSDGLLDAGDTLTAFGVDADTDVDGSLVNTHKSSFYVASNAAFDIHASATNLTADGDFSSLGYGNISFDLAVDDAPADLNSLNIGAAAQDPSAGGTGVGTFASLDDIDGGFVKVFDGGQRTAATRGSLAEQSVEFQATYALFDPTGAAGDQGYDLSLGAGTISADVTYTVYVP